MNLRKQIVAVLGIIILSLMLARYFVENEALAPQNYIFDKTSPVTVKDVVHFKTRVNFDEPKNKKQEIQEAQSDSLDSDIGGHTLKYFKYMEMKFKDFKTLDEHFAAVHAYLLQEMEPEEAEKLFHIYKQYLSCEMALAGIQKEWDAPTSMAKMLELLARTQAFRRETLGDELADALFEAGVKSREYAIRRSAIAINDELYGREKEALIDTLNDDMWGDNAKEMNDIPKPYVRYKEKLVMYKKDMEELSSEDDKTEMIKNFREELFSEEIVSRLEVVDKQIANEKNSLLEYRAAEKDVLENTDLSEQDKRDRIEALQNDHFDDPEAFQRRENMRLGMEALKNNRG